MYLKDDLPNNKEEQERLRQEELREARFAQERMDREEKARKDLRKQNLKNDLARLEGNCRIRRESSIS